MDETSTAERLKPNLASGNTRPDFLILIVMMIGAALGLLLLNTYQQNILTRFQSSAFLQNQLFFLELNRFVPHLIDFTLLIGQRFAVTVNDYLSCC